MTYRRLDLNGSPYLQAAAALLAFTGTVHSILGERLIFNRWRTARIVATGTDAHVAKRHARILWASWHGLTVFAYATAWIAATFSASDIEHPVTLRVLNTLIAACIAVALLVIAGTRGRHPGWVALILSAVLMTLGSR